jgi:adenylate kinase family enzyme
MRRVVIVGSSGSGKSTLGRIIAARIDGAFIEIDSIHHQADWVPLPADELHRRIDALTTDGNWVVDGNYRSVRPLLWSRADTIVWLDLPRSLVMRQLVVRTLGRVARRQVLWNGNRERWRNFFSLDPEQSVIVWSWTKHAHYRQTYAAAMAEPGNAHLTFVRLRSRRDVNRFVRTAG